MSNTHQYISVLHGMNSTSGGRAEILHCFCYVRANEEAYKRCSRGECLHTAGRLLLTQAPLPPRSLLPASSPLLHRARPSMLDCPDAQQFPCCTGCGCSALLPWTQEGRAHAGHPLIIIISQPTDAKKGSGNCSAPHPCPPPSQAFGGVEKYESGKQY